MAKSSLDVSMASALALTADNASALSQRGET